MDVRRLVRGGLDWDRIEAVIRELAVRRDREEVHVRFVEADNWLSIPCVVDEEWFVKIITPQNSLVHAVFTAGRNFGAVSSGVEGFFEHFETPLAMAEHELEAARKMNAAGIDAPAPVDAFEVDGLGVLVVEYLSDFRTLGDLSAAELRDLAPELFAKLRRLHDAGLVHGDLRAENLLVRDDGLFFIDATSVRRDPRALDGGRAYDVACALALLAPRIDPLVAVEAALEVYSVEDLMTARELLDFVNLRPDHGFDAARVKGEIEKIAA